MGGDKCRRAWPACQGERDGMAGIGRMRIDARSASRRACHVAGGVCGEKRARPLRVPLIGKASAAADHGKARSAPHSLMAGKTMRTAHQTFASTAISMQTGGRIGFLLYMTMEALKSTPIDAIFDARQGGKPCVPPSISTTSSWRRHGH